MASNNKDEMKQCTVLSDRISKVIEMGQSISFHLQLMVTLNHQEQSAKSVQCLLNQTIVMWSYLKGLLPSCHTHQGNTGCCYLTEAGFLALEGHVINGQRQMERAKSAVSVYTEARSDVQPLFKQAIDVNYNERLWAVHGDMTEHHVQLMFLVLMLQSAVDQGESSQPPPLDRTRNIEKALRKLYSTIDTSISGEHWRRENEFIKSENKVSSNPFGPAPNPFQGDVTIGKPFATPIDVKELQHPKGFRGRYGEPDYPLDEKKEYVSMKPEDGVEFPLSFEESELKRYNSTQKGEYPTRTMFGIWPPVNIREGTVQYEQIKHLLAEKRPNLPPQAANEPSTNQGGLPKSTQNVDSEESSSRANDEANQSSTENITEKLSEFEFVTSPHDNSLKTEAQTKATNEQLSVPTSIAVEETETPIKSGDKDNNSQTQDKTRYACLEPTSSDEGDAHGDLTDKTEQNLPKNRPIEENITKTKTAGDPFSGPSLFSSHLKSSSVKPSLFGDGLGHQPSTSAFPTHNPNNIASCGGVFTSTGPSLFGTSGQPNPAAVFNSPKPLFGWAQPNNGAAPASGPPASGPSAQLFGAPSTQPPPPFSGNIPIGSGLFGNFKGTGPTSSGGGFGQSNPPGLFNNNSGFGQGVGTGLFGSSNSTYERFPRPIEFSFVSHLCHPIRQLCGAPRSLERPEDYIMRIYDEWVNKRYISWRN